MDILDKVAEAITTARKDRDSKKIAFLTTLIADIQRFTEKDKSTDAQAKIVTKFINSIKETSKFRDDNPDEQYIPFLESLLPQQLTEAEVNWWIKQYNDKHTISSKADIGKVSAYIQSSIDPSVRFDKALVARGVSSYL